MSLYNAESKYNYTIHTRVASTMYCFYPRAGGGPARVIQITFVSFPMAVADVHHNNVVLQISRIKTSITQRTGVSNASQKQVREGEKLSNYF